MGAHSTQALGVVTFLVGVVLLAGALAAGGSVILIIAGLVLLVVSLFVFAKAKRIDESTE